MTSKEEPEQQDGADAAARDAQTRSFLVAAAAYLACLALLAVAAALKLIPVRPAVQIAIAVVSANATMYVLLRTAAGRRLSEKSLTWMQTLVALSILMFGVYHFDYDRALPLLLCLVILAFGVLRFSTREFVLATGVTLAGYAAVINLLMWLKPGVVDVYGEGLRWLGLALVLPCYALVGGRIIELRDRLKPTTEELTAARARIEQIATQDALTQLPNRALFTATLARAIASAKRHARPLAVIFLGVDRFKIVNDALGHAAGDQALQEAARRLSAITRASDFTARFGGDEFVILAEDYRNPHELVDLAMRLLSAFTPTFRVEGNNVALTASLGICAYPDGGTDAGELLSNADVAMHRAKEQGRNRFCFYGPELNEISREQLELEAQLSQALERNEFELHYQPKIAFRGGGITGVEALVRWRHPQHGLLPPSRFLRLAEESGFIGKLDLWGARRACEAMAAWRKQGLPRIPVAVNLSARQFNETLLPEALGAILAETGCSPQDLELEITENTVMRDPEHAMPIMHRLRGMGLRLTIDDFGTGYSSLGYLKRFPISCLKIDRTFVEDLPHSRAGLAISRAIIAMAHGLEMTVVAEGVELEGQHAALRAEGCDAYQGYYCRPALPEAELVAFVREMTQRQPSTRAAGDDD